MKKILGILLLAFLLLSPSQLMAWGKKGHGLVAEIAFKQLDRKTRKLVKQYLDGMSIEEAATWMDDIKKDPTFDALKPLHYVNLEKETAVKDECCDNVIHALNQTIDQLKEYPKLSPAEVKTKLCYLFHLIGDLHQPLHVGYGSDKGGNTYQIQFNGKGTNLHALFDYGLIEAQHITLRKCRKATSYSEEQLQALQSGDVISWAKESRSYLDAIYTTNGATISKAYTDANAVLVTQQLQKAGLRLAGILQQVFEPK